MSTKFPATVSELASATSEFTRTNKEHIVIEPTNLEEVLCKLEALLSLYKQVRSENVPTYVVEEQKRLSSYKATLSIYSETTSLSEDILDGFEVFKIVSAYVWGSGSPIPNREYIEYLKSLDIFEKDEFPMIYQEHAFDPKFCSYFEFSRPVSLNSVCFVLDPLLMTSVDPFLVSSVEVNFSHLIKVPERSQWILCWLEHRVAVIRPYRNLVFFLRKFDLKKSNFLLVRLLLNQEVLPHHVAFRSGTCESSPMSIAIYQVHFPVSFESPVEEFHSNQFGINLVNPFNAILSNLDMQLVKLIFVVLLSKFAKNRFSEILVLLGEIDDEKIARIVFSNFSSSPTELMVLSEFVNLDFSEKVKLNMDWLKAEMDPAVFPDSQVSSPFEICEYLVLVALGSEKGSEKALVVANNLDLGVSVNTKLVEQLLLQCFDDDVQMYSVPAKKLEEMLMTTIKKRIGFVVKIFSEDSSLLHGVMAEWSRWIDDSNDAALCEWILEANGPVRILESVRKLCHYPGMSEKFEEFEKIASELIRIIS